MAAMNAFLRRLDDPAIDLIYRNLDATWSERKYLLNLALEVAGLPMRVEGLPSVWTVLFTQPSRYNWMLQFYLRKHGLLLSWVGSGRMIFSLNYTDEQFSRVVSSVVAAAKEMQQDGWWWHAPDTTNKHIRRSVLREMLGQRLGR
jgi:glutamate-1-semialdehyde 2,1-aminomutase